MSKRQLRLIFGKQKAVKVLGLAGSSCTGKTSLATAFRDELNRHGLRASMIGQDQFYLQKNEVRTSRNAEDQSILFYDYDHIEALNEVAMLSAIKEASSADQPLDVLLVEGNMLTDLRSVIALVDCTLFLTIDKETCRQRRLLRVYDPPDEKGYFEQVVWPSYERTLQSVKLEHEAEKVPLMFMLSREMHIQLDDVIVAFQHLLCDRLILCRDPLSTEQALNWVSSPACGANSLFTGTTRDTFEGKRVLRLEYEAYGGMARVEMARLCTEVRTAIDPSILRIYIAHRIGLVPIGEISVVIAASAPQRRAAMAATQWLIDALKKRVPIWKKEVYEDGTCSWKENAEQPKTG